MKKKKLVSIILNCYNGEKFLRESLLSIKKQTYKNWELIFWDNQSTDSSKQIVYSFKFKKLRYFLSKKHTSLYQARNLAIKKAKGDFIAFIDSDDTWEKNKIKSQLEYFKDDDTAVVYGNSYLKNELSNRVKKIINYKVRSGFIYEDLIKNYNIGILTAMIKTSLLKKSKIKFNDKYNIIGDFDFFLKISKIYKFQFFPEPVATYRIHENNLSSIKKNLQIKELNQWLNLNKKKMTIEHFESIKKKIKQLEFINSKFSRNFLITVFFFLKHLNIFLNLKNIFVLFMPKILLKRIMWFS